MARRPSALGLLRRWSEELDAQHRVAHALHHRDDLLGVNGPRVKGDPDAPIRKRVDLDDAWERRQTPSDVPPALLIESWLALEGDLRGAASDMVAPHHGGPVPGLCLEGVRERLGRGLLGIIGNDRPALAEARVGRQYAFHLLQH
jgi:hypothetical protein